MLNYLITFLIITIVGYVYDKYRMKQERQERQKYEDVVQRFLLKEKPSITDIPILWVHIPREMNSRKWLHWGSRNTKAVNQPYLFLVLSAIVQQATGSFKICFIDDQSFTKVLPNWTIDIDKLAKPVKDNMRNLAIMKLLYYYGGMLIPHSYLPCKPLVHLYNNGLQNSELSFVNLPNHSVSYNSKPVTPSINFMASKKRSHILKQIIQELEYLYSTNFTDEVSFNNKICEIIEKHKRQTESNHSINSISSSSVGVLDKNNNVIGIEKLLSDDESPYEYDSIDGILIPEKDILNRTKYNWFASLPAQEVLKANTVLSRYLTASILPN